MTGDAIRVVLYSHDSQGLGHLRRNLALAHHLAEALPALTGRHVSGLIVTGLAAEHGFALPTGFDWLTLPGISKTAQGYGPRHLKVGRELLRDMRSGILDATFTGFTPDLVIVDRHVYGVWRELYAPLINLRRHHPDARIVLGLREVLDSPEVAAAEWRRLGDPAVLRELVDEVWVYGDPAVHDPVASTEIPAELHDRIRYTGYLAHGRRNIDRDGDAPPSPYILTTAGGGSDGHHLLRAAAAMSPPPGHEHIVVTGPQITQADFNAVLAAADPRTAVRRSYPGLASQINEASAVISMGGYNTVCEILDTTTPALIVPRERPRREQLIRARALTDVKALDLMRVNDIDPAALGRWSRQAVLRRVERRRIDGGGLQAVPRLAAQILGSDHRAEHCADHCPAPATERTAP